MEQLDTCTGVVEGERSCLLDKECGNMEKCCSNSCYTECSNLIEDSSMYNEEISLFYPFLMVLKTHVFIHKSACLKTEGPRVRASPVSLHCGP